MMDRAVDFWPLGMMEIIMQRDFKGIWIQAEIWLDDRLSAIDKIVLMEIDSLDRSEDGCFASNQSLAEFCKCSERKVSDSISKLTTLGYIRISGFDGRIRHIKSNVKTDSQKMRDRVAKTARQSSKICEADTQKLRSSNITINNNDNNNDNNPLVEKPRPEIPYGEIVDYLNEVVGTSYRPTTGKTKELIRARFKEGFTLEDFKTVIDNKAADWLNDKERKKYLRPETLFGTKFEGYLNQPRRKMTTKDLASKMDFSDFTKF